MNELDKKYIEQLENLIEEIGDCVDSVLTDVSPHIVNGVYVAQDVRDLINDVFEKRSSGE